MNPIITSEQLKALAPNACAAYRAAFASGQGVLVMFGIAASPLRLAHFMAQVLHESNALTLQFENLHYSRERLCAVWPARFRPLGPLDPVPCAGNQQRLANAVYGGRLGNQGPNDGYLYRGRGLLQLTGKDNYRKASQLLRPHFPKVPDFVRQPDAVVDSAWCLAVAAAWWQDLGCNALADCKELKAISLRINGGGNGMEARAACFARTRAVWPG